MTAEDEFLTSEVRSMFGSGLSNFGPDESTDAAFNKWLERVKAQAWDEGAEAVTDYFNAENPYRKETP